MLMQSYIIPIIKITDSCNFNCDFCYYAQRNLNSELMSLELCKKIIEETFEYNIRNNNSIMRIIFHGGEPLLQTMDFFEEIFAFEDNIKKKYSMEFLHSIQTNGFLLNTKWIEIIKERKIDIGVSIDGPVELNQHYNYLGKEKCTNKVIKNICKLNNANIPFGIISVITNKHTDHAKEIYEFCKINNIHNLSLNFCYNDEGGNSVDNDKLVVFLENLFDLYFNGSYELNIREFNEIIAKIYGYCTDTCATCNRESCGQYMTFDSSGNVFFCDTAYKKESALGNINKMSLYDIVDSTKYLNQILNSRKVYEKNAYNVKLRKYAEVVVIDMIQKMVLTIFVKHISIFANI